MGIFEQFFIKKPKTNVPFTLNELKEQIYKNRKVLSMVEDWIDKDAFSMSFFQYGIPDYIKKYINKEINNDITYSDLITHITNTYFEKANYLEMGVSVGKNFLQVLSSCPNLESAYGFDIENINPILEKKFQYLTVEKWSTPPNSIKKDDSTLKRYKSEGCISVNYLSGDVWDEHSWKKLRGQKFNVIFSDALHSAEAILFEFNMFVKYELLADRFIILWDDIVESTGMRNAFIDIYKQYRNKFKIEEYRLINVNGWIGQYEQMHDVGIISNFKF